MKRFSLGTNSAIVGGNKIKKVVVQGDNDDLGLNGESVMIKDTMLKAVNYESVFEKFQEKLQASSNETRLLFRQKRAQPH
jgi:vancomycin permeability regulator SanA